MNLTTFKQHTHKFLKHLKEMGKSQATCRSYRSDLEQFISFWKHIEKRHHQTFSDQNVVDRFMTHLFNQGARAHSIARKCSCLNSFKKYVCQRGEEATFKVKRPHYQQNTPTILTRDEITYLLDTIPVEELTSRYPYRDKAILELLYATGIRSSELVLVRVKDIYIDDYTIYVPRNHRYVFFGGKARERLMNYMTYERPTTESSHDYAFLNYQGTPLTTRSVQRICGSFSQHLQSRKKITPHVLRHAFAFHLLEQGADCSTVQHLLGNKTRLSLDRYFQLLYELDR